MSEWKRIAPERVEILKEYGFSLESAEHSCGMSHYFSTQIMFLDSRMLVQGDHATDYAHIIYAEVDKLHGLFYAPSLLEYLTIDYCREWNAKRMVRDLNKLRNCDISLERVGGIPMIYTEIYDCDWKDRDLRYQLSDMLKVIGQLDYILSRKEEKLRKARLKREQNRADAMKK